MSRGEGKKFLQLVVTEPGTEQKPACTDEDPELFFPNYAIGGDGEYTERRAKAVCRSCPIINSCLEFALHTGDKWGILGGTTPAERTSIRRNQTWRDAA